MFGGDSGGIGNLRRRAMGMFQNRITGWAIEVSETITHKRESTWDTHEKAVEGAQKAEEAGKKDQAIEDAFLRVQQKIILVCAEYFGTQQNPEKGIDDLRDAAEDLIVELHNPSTREAILLCVEEEHREDVRARLSEFGMLVWGVVDSMNNDWTDARWFTTAVMAKTQDIPFEEIVAKADGVRPEDVPEWVLESVLEVEE